MSASGRTLKLADSVDAHEHLTHLGSRHVGRHWLRPAIFEAQVEDAIKLRELFPRAAEREFPRVGGWMLTAAALIPKPSLARALRSLYLVRYSSSYYTLSACLLRKRKVGWWLAEDDDLRLEPRHVAPETLDELQIERDRRHRAVVERRGHECAVMKSDREDERDRRRCHTAVAL